MSATTVAQKQNYFAPSTTTKAASSPKDSSRDVTHPPIPELLDPAYLDKLLPAKPSAASATKTESSATATQSGAEAGAAFMAALKAEANKQYTQNSAHAFASTGNALVDAFNGLSQATDPADFEPTLRRSWAEDPLLTVKLIFNLRSIHEGKSEREGFYRAWGWLYRNHPRTAIANLSALVDPLIEKKLRESKKDKDAKVDNDEDVVLLELEDELEPRGLSHGYWKDLVNLLTLATEGQLDVGTSEFTALHPNRQTRVNARLPRGRRVATQKAKKVNRPRGHIQHAKGSKDPQTQDARIAESLKRDAEASDKAKAARQSKEANWREYVQKLLTDSKPYKALYITVAQLFAKALEADIDILKRISDPATDDKQRIKLSFEISLCAKYAPSINGSHDRVTNIASAISELLWNKGKLRIPYDQTAAASPTKDLVHDLRASYTRWILSPLRRFLQLPEVYMSSNKWNELPYKRVASTCMQKNKGHFFQHDESRFSNYLKDVAAGKRTISGATLLPHSLLGEALKVNRDSSDPAAQAEVQVIEAQWKTMVDKLKESGTMENSMAVCDVSGSMGHILDSTRSGNYDNVSPILPAVALSLVLSQVSAEPWANSFITFSQHPEIVKIDPTAGLVETANKMVTAAWDMNTDFNAVFTKLILPMAIEHKLPKEAMIKRLFVFSDMEFDQSGGTLTKGGTDRWTTEHEKIVKAFEAAGYDCPDIVYWNLQGARGAKPVQADWEGVAVMSGFSSNMLKTFMDKGGLDEEQEDEIEVIEQIEGDEIVVKKKEKKKMTPEDIMKKALNKPSYATLVVVD